MRVFVTGSTGFVGTGVVKELHAAGHSVLGLTRSEKGAASLRKQGAEALLGTIEDVEILKHGASQVDAVIHTAFNHGTDFIAACAADKVAITTLGEALVASAEAEGKEKALVITSGTMLLQHGKLVDEDSPADLSNPIAAARGAGEALCHSFAKPGVLRTSVVRLPPTVHGPGNCGFVGFLARTALEKGAVAYVGEGTNRWCGVHRDDAVKVYVLAAEKAPSGSAFHAVAEESVSVKEIATEIGRLTNTPVVSLSADKAAEHFGWFQFGAGADNIASSKKTRESLGWNPTGKTVMEDIQFAVDFAKAGHA